MWMLVYLAGLQIRLMIHGSLVTAFCGSNTKDWLLAIITPRRSLGYLWIFWVWRNNFRSFDNSWMYCKIYTLLSKCVVVVINLPYVSIVYLKYICPWWRHDMATLECYSPYVKKIFTSGKWQQLTHVTCVNCCQLPDFKLPNALLWRQFVVVINQRHFDGLFFVHSY